MNFGFSCLKKLACCLPQIYKWAANSYVDYPLRANSPGITQTRDVPLLGTLSPNVTKQGDWVYVTSTSDRFFAIASDGSLWGWGESYHPLGDGNLNGYKKEPVLIDDGPWLKVSASSADAVVGLKSDKTLWQWGHTLPLDRTGATNAQLRAVLSSPIAGGLMLQIGRYSKTPTASIVKRKVRPGSYEYWASSWSVDSGDAGSGATAEPIMQYLLTAGPSGDHIVTSPGSGYTSDPVGTLTDGLSSTNVKVGMSYKVTKVNVTNGGGGYSSKPTVSMPNYSSGGVAATAVVSKMGRLITSATITDGGSGYISSPAVLVNGTLTDRMIANVESGSVTSLEVLCGLRVDEETVNISFLSSSGSGAAATATSRMNHVVEVSVQSSGSGYSAPPSVVFSGGGGFGAEAKVEVSGFVTGLAGYSTSQPNPVISFSSPPTLTIAGGNPVSPGDIEINYTGIVTGIKILNGGSGYTSDGSRISPVCIFQRQQGDKFGSDETDDAIFICYVEPSPVSAINVTDGGSGYSTQRSSGTVRPITSNERPYVASNTRMYLQAGTRIEDLTRTVSGSKETWSFAGSSGWPYTPYLVTVNQNGERSYSLPSSEPFAGLAWTVSGGLEPWGGMPFPRQDLDIVFSVPSPIGTASRLQYEGRGAKASAVISETGVVSSVRIDRPGESYYFEPGVSITSVVVHPRQVGTSLWKDVACGYRSDYRMPGWYAIAINDSDSLLYRWGNLFGTVREPLVPTKLGKRLVGDEGSIDFTKPLEFPRCWIAPPDLPGELAVGATNNAQGMYNGLVSYSKWGTRKRAEVWQSGYTEGYGRTSGVTMLANTGFGYTSIPQTEAYGAATSISVSLYGPDQCRSVFVQEDKAYAIDASGRLWRINSSSPAPGKSFDTTNDFELRSSTSVNGTYTSRDWSYVDSQDTSLGIQTFKNYGGAYFQQWYLSHGGTGYSDKCSIKITGTKWRIRMWKSTSDYWSSDQYGYYSTQTRDSSFTELAFTQDFTDEDYPLPAYASPGSVATLKGSVVSPVGFTWSPPGERATQRANALMPTPPFSNTSSTAADGSVTGKTVSYYPYFICIDSGTPVVVDPTGAGTGAVFTRDSSSIGKTFHYGSGPIEIGQGASWDFATNGSADFSHGRTSDGVIRFFDDNLSSSPPGFGNPNATRDYMGTPFPVAEQKPYLSIRGTLGVLEDQSMRRLPSIKKSGSNAISQVQGDVELVIANAGSGYVEPIVAKFSSQPPEAAVISSSLDGKVTAVGVISRGSGYNSPPTVSVGGSATIKSVISGPLHSVTVTSPGSGYRNPPRVSFSQPGISGTATSTLNATGGVQSVSVSSGGEYRSPPSVTFTPVPDVESISVDSGGDGYASPPSVVIVSNGGYGTGAAGSCVIDGKVVSVVIHNPGFGYTSAPTVEFISTDDGVGSGVAATASINQSTGELLAINITSQGSMYQKAPQIRLVGGSGSGVGAYAVISGPVSRVDLTARGSDYRYPPKVFFTGGGGSGATATATTAAPGSGAAATARINGELLYCDVTSGGSGYTSCPTVSVSGGDNVFINEAQGLFSAGDITAEELNATIEKYQAKCMARMSGAATFSLVSGGDGYGTNTDSNRYSWGRQSGYFKKPAFRVLGPDTRGTIRGIDSTKNFFGTYGIYGQLEYNGKATASTSEPPGGPLTSVSSSEFANVKFTAPPLAIPEDACGIIARTSMRLCGIALESSQHPDITNSSFRTHSGTYKSFRNGSADAASVGYGWTGTLDEGNGVNQFSQPRPGPLPRLRTFLYGASLTDPGLASSTRFFMQQYRFDELPTMSFESDIGSGATIKVTVGSDGLASGSLDKAGSGYGNLLKVAIRGGRMKVTEAKAVAVVSNGRIVDIIVTDNGGGYISPPLVVIHGGGGTGASAVAFIKQATTSYALPVPSGVLRIDMIQCGSGYTSPPDVTIVSQDMLLEDMPLTASETFALRDFFANVITLKQPKLEFLELSGSNDDSSRRMSICAYPLVNGGPSPSAPILKEASCVFYDQGYLDSVCLESSFGAYGGNAYDLPQFYEPLPEDVAVVLDGTCDTSAAVDVIRPKWSNMINGNGAMIAVRDTTQP